MSWFKKDPCVLCGEKDKTIDRLVIEIEGFKRMLAHSREREERAVDVLLENQGKRPVAPPPKMTTAEADRATEDLMGMFKDEDDKGDGRILEAHQVNVHNQPNL